MFQVSGVPRNPNPMWGLQPGGPLKEGTPLWLWTLCGGSEGLRGLELAWVSGSSLLAGKTGHRSPIGYSLQRGPRGGGKLLREMSRGPLCGKVLVGREET